MGIRSQSAMQSDRQHFCAPANDGRKYVLRALFVLQPLAKVCMRHSIVSISEECVFCTRQLFQQPTTTLARTLLALGIDCSHELKKTTLLIAGFSLAKTSPAAERKRDPPRVCSWLYTIYESNLAGMRTPSNSPFLDALEPGSLALCAYLV